MPKGRPPKPTTIHWLNGDPSKNRRYTIEPTATGLPIAPQYLDAVAAAEWASIVPMLADMQLLGAIDGKALAAYCECFSVNRQANEWIKANGIFNDKGREAAAVRIARDTANQLKAWLIEFGCTPAARARMRVQPKEKQAAGKWRGLLGTRT